MVDDNKKLDDEIELTDEDLDEVDEMDDLVASHPHQSTTIDRVPFFKIFGAYETLNDIFPPLDEEDAPPNEKFLAVWLPFLAIAGWSEDEFIDAITAKDPCPVCGSEQEDEEVAVKHDPKKDLN